MEHITDDLIHSYFDNELSIIQKKKIKAHILECEVCNNNFKILQSLQLNFKKFGDTEIKDEQFVLSVMDRILDKNSKTSKSFIFNFFENWLVPIASFSCAIFILFSNAKNISTNSTESFLLASEDNNANKISELSIEILLNKSFDEDFL